MPQQKQTTAPVKMSRAASNFATQTNALSEDEITKLVDSIRSTTVCDDFSIGDSDSTGTAQSKSGMQRSSSFPSETDLQELALVQPLPTGQVKGKLLLHSQLAPIREAGRVTKLLLQHPRGLLGRNKKKTVSVLDSKGQPYAGGSRIHFEGKKLFHNNAFVLYDTSDRPLALCKQVFQSTVKTYLIYGTNPLYGTDKPQTTRGKYSFYPWFRVQEPAAIDGDRLIYVWDGVIFSPMWTATHRQQQQKQKSASSSSWTCSHKHAHASPQKEMIIRSQNTALGCMVQRDKGDKKAWEVTIAPGVHPALMICLGAILDESCVWSNHSH